jgi:hypothetical protein
MENEEKCIVKSILVNTIIIIAFTLFILLFKTTNTEIRCVANGDIPTMLVVIGILYMAVGFTRLFMDFWKSCVLTFFLGLGFLALGLGIGVIGFFAAMFTVCFLFCIAQNITRVFDSLVMVIVISIGVICLLCSGLTPAKGTPQLASNKDLYENCTEADWAYGLCREDRMETTSRYFHGLYKDAVIDRNKKAIEYAQEIYKKEGVMTIIQKDEIQIFSVPKEVAIQSGDVNMAKRAERVENNGNQ